MLSRLAVPSLAPQASFAESSPECAFASTSSRPAPAGDRAGACDVPLWRARVAAVRGQPPLPQLSTLRGVQQRVAGVRRRLVKLGFMHAGRTARQPPVVGGHPDLRPADHVREPSGDPIRRAVAKEDAARPAAAIILSKLLQPVHPQVSLLPDDRNGLVRNAGDARVPQRVGPQVAGTRAGSCARYGSLREVGDEMPDVNPRTPEEPVEDLNGIATGVLAGA